MECDSTLKGIPPNKDCQFEVNKNTRLIVLVNPYYINNQPNELYKEMAYAIQKKRVLTLDFTEVGGLWSNWIEDCFGKLFKNFPVKDYKTYIKLVNYQKHHIEHITKYIITHFE